MVQKKLALSFSGGGARAFCYLGVLRCLEENGIKVDILQGFSGGAILLCFLASDLTDEEIVREFTKFNFYRFFSWNPVKNGGFLSFKKTVEALRKYTKGKDIKELPYKTFIYTSEISDVGNPRPVKHSEGDLAKVAAISCIVPPFWPPYKEKGNKYVDGGITVLYGTRGLKDEGAEVVVGCLASGTPFVKMPKIVSNVSDAVESLISQINEKEATKCPPDFVLTDFDTKAGLNDFKKAREMYFSGYRKAEKNLPRIKSLVTS